jgi:ADP-ribose pyrophosphatase YjhB (NUDIX family)
VTALIARDNSILLCKRAENPFKDYWGLPGGYVEWDESAEDALAREVKEETGLTVIRSRLLRVYSSPRRDPSQAITLTYEVEAVGKAQIGDGQQECRMFASDSLPNNLAFDHGLMLSEYFASQTQLVRHYQPPNRKRGKIRDRHKSNTLEKGRLTLNQ